MKVVCKILIGCLISLSALTSLGQTETYLQSFSSPILINPTFAGLNKNTSFYTGNQFYYLNKNRSYNLLYATYDTYSDKLKGGIGFSFQHGIIGERNTNITELGFSYAGFERNFNGGRIIFSANMGLSIATKHWFTYFLDRMLIKKEETVSPPGKKFKRYALFKPGTGFLFNINTFTMGVSGNIPLQLYMAEEDDFLNSNETPFSLSFYLEKKLGGNRRGLKSSPFKTTPQLTLFYNNEFILSRLRLKVEHIDKSLGIFIQNDFTNNIHCVGGTVGYRFNNLRVNLNSGVGVPGISDEIGITCELAINVIIPPIHYSKIYPWAPKQK